MAQIDRAFTVKKGLSLADEVLIHYTVSDPTGGYEAPVGSLLLQKPASGEAQLWKKYDTGDNDWKKLASKAYESTSDPTSTNDGADTASLGLTFDRGDIWVNTTDDAIFLCADNTTSGAVWSEMGTGGGVDLDQATTINESGNDVDFRVEGDTLDHMIHTDGTASTENIALLSSGQPGWNSMDRGIFIGNVTTAPTGNPTSGGYLFVENGALKYRSPNGVTKTIAPA